MIFYPTWNIVSEKWSDEENIENLSATIENNEPEPIGTADRGTKVVIKRKTGKKQSSYECKSRANDSNVGLN